MGNSTEILKMLYDNLYTNLTLDKKLKKKSVLISFLEMKSNVRYRYINDCSENLFAQDTNNVTLLIKSGFIRPTEELNHYSITARGVWEIEREDVISPSDIIDFIDDKYFDVSLISENITDKEKVVLMTLIAARAFSDDSSIDLRKDNYTLDACKRIIDKCYLKLHELGLVRKMNELQLYGKRGNEHIVSHLIRHTDSLPKKTKGIYKAAGSQKYYLDIIENNTPDTERLIFLLQRIFTNAQDLSYDGVLSLCLLCTEVAYDEAPYLHDKLEDSFSTPEYDDLIIDAFNKSLII